MSKRKAVSDDGASTPEVIEKKIKEKIELSVENKMLVLQTLIPNAHELFEKFNPNFNKRTSKHIWMEAVTELAEYGVVFKDWYKLKETVRNWYGRAIKRADALNKTGGSGRPVKQLTEFEKQCQNFVRACKGNLSADLTQCIENPDTDTEQNNDETESEKSCVEEQQELLQILIKEANGDIPQRTSTATISTCVNKTNTNADSNVQDWKKKYFKSVEDIEKARVETQTMESDANRYLLFLKTTLLEQQLGLNEIDIRKIRKSIASKLSIEKMPVILKPSNFFVANGQETNEDSNDST